MAPSARLSFTATAELTNTPNTPNGNRVQKPHFTRLSPRAAAEQQLVRSIHVEGHSAGGYNSHQVLDRNGTKAHRQLNLQTQHGQNMDPPG